MTDPTPGSEHENGSSSNPEFDRALEEATRNLADGGRAARQQAEEARAAATRQLNETAELVRRAARERNQSVASTRVYDDIAKGLERAAVSLNRDYETPVGLPAVAQSLINPLWIGALALVFALLFGWWLRNNHNG